MIFSIYLQFTGLLVWPIFNIVPEALNLSRLKRFTVMYNIPSFEVSHNPDAQRESFIPVQHLYPTLRTS